MTMRIAALSVASVVLLSVSVVAQQTEEQVYRPGDGVSLPRVVKDVKVHYTPNALRERVQGTVWLECVVSTAGTTRNIEVVKPLHEELDAQAVDALKQWEFEPGKKDGKPVAVRITVEMTFTLK